MATPETETVQSFLDRMVGKAALRSEKVRTAVTEQLVKWGQGNFMARYLANGINFVLKMVHYLIVAASFVISLVKCWIINPILAVLVYGLFGVLKGVVWVVSKVGGSKDARATKKAEKAAKRAEKAA